MEAYPNVVPRKDAEFSLWGEDPPDSDSLRSHIYKLRCKVDKGVSLIIMLGLYGWAQYGIARVTEDEVINNILRNEAEDYFKRYTADRNAQLPQMLNLQAF
ncbi:hypothetical protein ADUPG1_004190, partial [Aduncisulcus paluster]